MFHVKHFDLKIEKYSSLIHSIENLKRNIFSLFLLNLSKQKSRIHSCLSSSNQNRTNNSIFPFFFNLAKQKSRIHFC